MLKKPGILVLLALVVLSLGVVQVLAHHVNDHLVLQQTDNLKSIRPDYAGLSVDQQLDRSLTLPGIHGVLRGTTSSPIARTLSITSDGFSQIVTEFPFKVVGFLGPGTSPYPVGTTITLRIPGGTVGNIRSIVEDVPSIRPNADIFVFVRDHGTYLGGNTGVILIATDDTDLFTVRNGIVSGQGKWKQLSESLAAFEKHFVH